MHLPTIALGTNIEKVPIYIYIFLAETDGLFIDIVELVCLKFVIVGNE